MYKENIDLILNLVNAGNPEYGILSFTSDTLDAMKSALAQTRLGEPERQDFDKSMKKIVAGLRDLDQVLDKIFP